MLADGGSCLGRFSPLHMKGSGKRLPTATSAKQGHGPLPKHVVSLLACLPPWPVAKTAPRPSPFPRLCTPAKAETRFFLELIRGGTPSFHSTPDPNRPLQFALCLRANPSWGDSFLLMFYFRLFYISLSFPTIFPFFKFIIIFYYFFL